MFCVWGCTLMPWLFEVIEDITVLSSPSINRWLTEPQTHKKRIPLFISFSVLTASSYASWISALQILRRDQYPPNAIDQSSIQRFSHYWKGSVSLSFFSFSCAVLHLLVIKKKSSSLLLPHSLPLNDCLPQLCLLPNRAWIYIKAPSGDQYTLW